VYQRVPHFGRNDFSIESERLKTREKRGDYRVLQEISIVLAYP